MTLGGWITFGIFAAVIIAAGISAAYVADSTRVKVIAVIIAIVLCIALLAGMFAWYSKTESGKRAVKSWKSETNAGIERHVRVYDVNGDLLEEYEGRFDIDYDENRIIFDDQDGKRHVIYYPTGTVIVDEK